jgi:hypothetical protein
MVYQEFTKEEARELGAFREDALSEKDAIQRAFKIPCQPPLVT